LTGRVEVAFGRQGRRFVVQSEHRLQWTATEPVGERRD
jgi:hypothetical protein